MKIILIVFLIAFLVSCAPIKDIDNNINNWEEVGDGLYRKIDHQLNVACYYAVTSVEYGVAFACVSYKK